MPVELGSFTGMSKMEEHGHAALPSCERNADHARKEGRKEGLTACWRGIKYLMQWEEMP